MARRTGAAPGNRQARRPGVQADQAGQGAQRHRGTQVNKHKTPSTSARCRRWGRGPPLAPVHPKRCRNGPETPGFRWAGAACRDTRSSYVATLVHPCTLVAGRECQRDRQRRHPLPLPPICTCTREGFPISLSPCPLQHAQGFSHCPGLVERHWQAVARRCMHRHCRRPPRSVPPTGHRYLYEAATRTPHCTNPSVQYAGYSSLLHTYTTRGVLRLLGTAPLGVCLFLLSACSPARIRPRIRVAHAHKSAQGQPSKARKGRERRRGGAWSEGERRHARRTAVSQGPASTFDGFPVGRACECLLVPPSAKYIRVQWRAVRRALCAVPWPSTVPVRPAGADLAGLLPAASCLVRWFVCVPALGKVVYHIGRVGVAPTLPCTSGQQCTGTMGRGGPLLCEGPLVCCSARVSCVSQHLFIRNCV